MTSELKGAELAFYRATKRYWSQHLGRPKGVKDKKRRRNSAYFWTEVALMIKFFARCTILTNGQSDCWLWTGASTRGFGYMVYGSRQDHGGKQPRIQAHRLSWLIHNGDLNKKELVGQECGRKLCVNPDHLFTWRR